MAENDYVIKIEGLFSTSVFYNHVIEEVNKCFRTCKNGTLIVFDLTTTTYIDALVIPNLLCLGFVIKKLMNVKPLISTVNHDVYVDKFRIDDFLFQIGFLKEAMIRDLFVFNNINNESRDYRIRIPDYCTTFAFNNNKEEKAEIAKTIMNTSDELFRKYLRAYYTDDDIFGYGNIFAKFAAELCNNASVHGDSFSFMTIHANMSLSKLFIATSDIGTGFYESFKKKIITGELEHPLITQDDSSFLSLPDDKKELYAILEGAFYRFFNKAYGIWDIADIVLSQGGIIRIHSENSRIIITPRFYPTFKKCQTEEELKTALFNFLIQQKDINFITNLKFGGVHYEIEMPIEDYKG